MEVGDGRMVFCHCSVCDTNFWTTDGGHVVDLTGVLERAASVPAPRRGPRPKQMVVSAVPERFRVAA